MATSYLTNTGTLRIDALPVRIVRVAGALHDLHLGGADAPTLTLGGLSSPTAVIQGAVASADSTVFDLFRQFRHPERAVVVGNFDPQIGDAGDFDTLRVVVSARRTGTPNTAASLAASCFRSDLEGGVDTSIGATGQLVTTGSVNLLSVSEGAWAEHTFEIDASDLDRGDPLNLLLRATCDDTGGSGGGRIEIADVAILAHLHL